MQQNIDNAKALKKSKDVTVINQMTHKQIFDMLNKRETDEGPQEGQLFAIKEGTNFLNYDEKENDSISYENKSRNEQ